MVDCEKQEPFYPVTHAQAIQVIDEGELKNLQDVLGVVLEFVRNFGSFDFGDKLELGYTSHNAFRGSDGKDLMDKMEELYPLATEVSQGELKPVTGGAIYDFVQGFAPSGRVEDGDTQAVAGDTVYDYI
ncbi:hypothetical protein [Lachnospira sp.]|jgi:hypothetical protein|uniref:hypothetical protein n=1 Tax=Lachnospira sp. TaxID=2049031 RepID=UPI00257F644B|nr:hypothetical protein [Lachnospira sp.]